MKKRLFASLLCIAFILTTALGCAASNQPATTQPEATPAAAQETPAEQSAAPAASEPAATPQEAYKVAAIYSGAVNDMNWNTAGYNGLLKIEAMGAQISYQENVAFSDSANSLYTYGTEGYDLIIVNSSTHQQSVMEVAPDFPDQDFMIVSGDVTEGNIYSVQIADEEQGFMMGVIAALATQNKKVGFVLGSQISPITNGYKGFINGVNYIDDTIEIVDYVITVSNNVNEGKEATIAMIDANADVIASIADNASLGVLEACEQRNVWTVAPGIDMGSVAPTALLVGISKDSSVAYEAFYKEWISGNKPTDVVRYGVDAGIVNVGEWQPASDTALTAEEKDQVMKIFDDLKNGKIEIDLSIDIGM